MEKITKEKITKRLDDLEEMIGRDKRLRLEKKSFGTKITYYQILHNFGKWLRGLQNEEPISKDNIEKLCKEYIYFKSSNGRCPNTLNKINSCFTFAFDIHFERNKTKIKKLDIPNTDTVKKVSEILQEKDDELWLAFKLLEVTGMRISELVKLKRKYFNEDGTLLVKAGKGKRDRIVFVTEEILQTIQAKSGRIFKSKYLGFRLNRLMKELSGMTNFTAHKLRHYCCSKLVNEKIFNVIEARDYMGHANISTTTNVYLHANLNEMKKKFTENFK
jgi:integrase